MNLTGRTPRLQQALLIPLVVLAWLAVVVSLGWALSHVARALLILVVGTLIAFALTPLVNLLARWLPRGLAIAATYLIGLILIITLLNVVIASVVSEISNLVAHLPDYLRQVQSLQPTAVSLLKPIGITNEQLNQVEAQAVTELQHQGSTVANDAINLVPQVLGAIVDVILVLIISIYLTASGPRLFKWISTQAPFGSRRRTTLFVGILNQVVGGYIRGTFVLATLVGGLVGAGMALLHVRYALVLGILAFFMEFVPVLGVMVSGALCVVVALFTGPLTAILVIVYFVVVHVIEGDVVGPRIMGKAVGIHPAVAIIALVAGSELFGIWGALFGAPLAGLIQAFAVALYREVRLLNARDAREISQELQAERNNVEATERAEGTAKAGARNVLTTIAQARQRLRPSEKK